MCPITWSSPVQKRVTSEFKCETTAKVKFRNAYRSDKRKMCTNLTKFIKDEKVFHKRDMAYF